MPSSQEQLCIQLGILRPGLNFTIAIPLKAGSQIKGGAMAKRAEMEQRSLLRRTASGSCMDRCISTFQPGESWWTPRSLEGMRHLADLMGIKGVPVQQWEDRALRSIHRCLAIQHLHHRWRLAILAITSQSEVDVPRIYIYIFKCMYIHVICFLFIHMRRTTTWNILSVELAPML